MTCTIRRGLRTVRFWQAAGLAVPACFAFCVGACSLSREPIVDSAAGAGLGAAGTAGNAMGGAGGADMGGGSAGAPAAGSGAAGHDGVAGSGDPTPMWACGDPSQCEAGQGCVAGACQPASCELTTGCGWNQECDAIELQCRTVICGNDTDCGEGRACFRLGCSEPCRVDADCFATGFFCDTLQGHCAECSGHSDCPLEQHCAVGRCRQDICVPGTAAFCADQAGLWRCDEHGASLQYETCPGSTRCSGGIFLPGCR